MANIDTGPQLTHEQERELREIEELQSYERKAKAEKAAGGVSRLSASEKYTAMGAKQRTKEQGSMPDLKAKWERLARDGE